MRRVKTKEDPNTKNHKQDDDDDDDEIDIEHDLESQDKKVVYESPKEYGLAGVIIQQYYAAHKGDPEEEKEEGKEIDGIKQIVDKSLNVIIGFIASFISSLILAEDQATEVTIMILVMYAIWITMDRFIKNYVRLIWILQKNSVYRQVVIAVIGMVSSLGIYTLSVLGLTILKGLWESSNINNGEAFVSISTIIISLYSAYFTYDYLGM